MTGAALVLYVIYLAYYYRKKEMEKYKRKLALLLTALLVFTSNPTEIFAEDFSSVQNEDSAEELSDLTNDDFFSTEEIQENDEDVPDTDDIYREDTDEIEFSSAADKKVCQI